MNIAHVCPYDFAHPGGVASHILAIEPNMTRMGHAITIIAPASREVRHTKARFLSLGKSFPVPVSGSVARISLSPKLASRVREILSRTQFDIIHLHEPFMPMLCTTVLRHSDTVTVGTFHATEGKPGYMIGWPIGPIMFRRWARKLNGKIACCQEALGYARKFIPGPYEMIPDGGPFDFKTFITFSFGKIYLPFSCQIFRINRKITR